MLRALSVVMMWMEMIRLRTARYHMEDVNNLLLDAAKQAESQDGLLRLCIYQSMSLETDLALSLVWRTRPEAGAGSRVGRSICNVLESFGLVDHSVWIPRQDGTNS